MMHRITDWSEQVC